METLHITTPADHVSLIGHSLGYWPHESFVCLTLQNNRIGATLRLDLPTTPAHATTYARKVGSYLRTDQDATAAVFAIFTNTTATATVRPSSAPSSNPSLRTVMVSGSSSRIALAYPRKGSRAAVLIPAVNPVPRTLNQTA